MLEKFDVDLKSATIKVYVSNLGAYNAGTLTGDWTTLPVENVKAIFEADRKKYGEVEGYGEEYFITDYEAPFKVEEFENLHELNNLAKALKNNHLDTIEDVFYSLESPENIYISSPVEFDDDTFEELTLGMSKMEVARATNFGEINWSDELIRVDELGNFETLSTENWYRELNENSQEIVKEFAEENGIELF